MIINIKKIIVEKESNIKKIFELTYSTNYKTRKLIARENERIRLKKKGIYIDESFID